MFAERVGECRLVWQVVGQSHSLENRSWWKRSRPWAVMCQHGRSYVVKWWRKRQPFTVSETRRSKLERAYGEDVRIWADSVGGALTQWAEANNATLGSELDGGRLSIVVEATLRSGADVVVKANMSQEAAEAEVAWLRAAAPSGFVVEVVDFDEPLGLLVLERVKPGTAMSPSGSGAARRGLEVAAAIHAHTHGLGIGTPMAERVAAMSATAVSRLEADKRLTDRDRELLISSLVTPECSGDVSCHGDLYHWNLLERIGGPPVVIDPMPTVGAAEFDVGGFAAKLCDRAGRVGVRVGEVIRAAAGNGFDPDAVLAWARWSAVERLAVDLHYSKVEDDELGGRIDAVLDLW